MSLLNLYTEPSVGSYDTVSIKPGSIIEASPDSELVKKVKELSKTPEMHNSTKGADSNVFGYVMGTLSNWDDKQEGTLVRLLLPESGELNGSVVLLDTTSSDFQLSVWRGEKDLDYKVIGKVTNYVGSTDAVDLLYEQEHVVLNLNEENQLRKELKAYVDFRKNPTPPSSNYSVSVDPVKPSELFNF